MGQIVGACGVPHTPRFPILAREDSPFGHELTRLYGEVAARLAEMRPDVVVIISTDHLQTYFSDLPIFSIGVAETTDGPCDFPDLPAYKLAIDAPLAQHIQHHVVKSGYDVGMNQEFSLDHTFVIPYHFLARDLDVPIIPLFLSGLVAPTPTASRCFALGRVLRSAIEAADDDKRVAIVASGSFSLDLGGIHEGSDPHLKSDGVPDSAWVDRILGFLSDADFPGLVDQATEDQLFHAGNIGGELLNWIAMLGTIEAVAPTFLERHGSLGHAYGAWQLG